MHPFQMIGVDYASTGRLGRTEGKAYIALYACFLNRTPYLNLMTEIHSKEVWPQKIPSDNGTMFVGAPRWLHENGPE